MEYYNESPSNIRGELPNIGLSFDYFIPVLGGIVECCLAFDNLTPLQTEVVEYSTPIRQFAPQNPSPPRKSSPTN